MGHTIDKTKIMETVRRILPLVALREDAEKEYEFRARVATANRGKDVVVRLDEYEEWQKKSSELYDEAFKARMRWESFCKQCAEVQRELASILPPTVSMIVDLAVQVDGKWYRISRRDANTCHIYEITEGILQ